jgi:transposase
VATVSIICATIKEAIKPTEGKKAYRLISCDEKTGMQALKRYQQQMPSDKGGQLRQEFEYTRHGTLCLIAGIDVATGQLCQYTLGPTRTEQDWLCFIEQQVSTLEADEDIVFMMDQLNTHKSASLVRWVAAQVGYAGDLGIKGKSGILKSQTSRMAFLESTHHCIRFVFTPKHCSWLNPIENWFGRLGRSVLNGLSVSSLEELEEKVVAFITYYNGCLAKAFDWLFDGFAIERPLACQRR